MKTVVTPRDLWMELAEAYELLAHTLPLALQRLSMGGVRPVDQHSFWSAYERLDEVINSRREPDAAGVLDALWDEDTKPNGPGVRSALTDRAMLCRVRASKDA